MLLLAAGAAGAYVALRPKLPRERDVAFDLGAGASETASLEVLWTDATSPDREPALGTTVNFPEKGPPRVVHEKVRLPDGEWDVDITVVHGTPRETTRIQRRVNLETESVMLPLERDLR